MKKVHIRRARRVEMCGGPDAGPVMATTAGLTGIDIDETGMPGTIMLSLAVGPYVAGWSATIRRQIMAGDAAGRVGHRIDCMANKYRLGLLHHRPPHRD